MVFYWLGKLNWVRKESSKQPEVEQEKREKSYGADWVRKANVFHLLA